MLAFREAVENQRIELRPRSANVPIRFLNCSIAFLFAATSPATGDPLACEICRNRMQIHSLGAGA
jgi:hypothetical protein